MFKALLDKLLKKPINIPESLKAFAAEAMQSDQDLWRFDVKLLKSAGPLQETFGNDRRVLIVEICRLLSTIQQTVQVDHSYGAKSAEMRLYYGTKALLASVIRGHFDFSENEIIEFLHFASRQKKWTGVPIASFVGFAERFVETHGPTKSVSLAIEAVIEKLLKGEPEAEIRKLCARLRLLVSSGDIVVPLSPTEPWAIEALADINALPPPMPKQWAGVMAAAQKVSGTSPSRKFLEQARVLLTDLGVKQFEALLTKWMISAGTRSVKVPNPSGGGGELEAGLDPENADILKGLIWMAASLDDPFWAVPMGDLAERCYKKIPWIGPRCAKVGNACVSALSQMSGDAPASQLSRLKQKVKQPSGKRMTEKALGRFADRSGMTVDEVEERGVPDCGMAIDGTRRDVFGEFTCITSIADGSEVDVQWIDSDGKQRKSIPTAIKTDHAAAWKSLQAIHKQLKSTLTAQRFRLDQLFIQERSWSYSNWRTFYCDQPIVGQIARRLIWLMDDSPVSCVEGKLLDVLGKKVAAKDDSVVRLWHPALRSADEVLAWRVRLEALGVTQPFKQVYREVYLLTDAERHTETYSNRYAAHILRQHQFQALCQQRGWTYRLQGNFDGGGGHPERIIPQWKLRAEFWVDATGNQGDASGTGIFLYVATDQVRYYPLGDDSPMPIEKVPPLVFTEIMRDVDLFVGVASVGNDPTWNDGGPGGLYRDYWREFSFGELTESAQTRRAVLENLLPKLSKLNGKWSFADRYLIVKGSKRTYKIHLGSGNILMEPNDQYLCIVPDRSPTTTQNVYLPFEGDHTLSIILSKALLLAEDDKIKDATIVRQIG